MYENQTSHCTALFLHTRCLGVINNCSISFTTCSPTDIQITFSEKKNPTLFLCSPRAGGQDRLIKYVHTLFDLNVLQCQYVNSIVFMLRSFCSQRD